MPPKDKYTDPKLRDEVKEEIHNSDKGGAPGQWSARKAQMMAQEYKRRGGGYNTDKSEKDESQQHLSNWTDEEWQTKEGSGHAKKEDGTEKRYLPKKAWENMTEEEKEETEEKKQEGSKNGKQYVSNTGKAKQSRKKASKDDNGGEDKENDEEEGSGEEEEDQEEEGGKNDGKGEDKAKNNEEASAKDKEAADDEDDDQEYQEGEEDDNEEDDEDDEDEENDDEDKENGTTGSKRKSKQSNGTSKKQKSNSGSARQNGTVGSKHMNAQEPGERGSKDRLPKKGQQIQWKAMPGYVEGEVVEILTKDKTVDGKSVKATEADPRIVLKSKSSGKICVHKPDACFFD